MPSANPYVRVWCWSLCLASLIPRDPSQEAVEGRLGQRRALTSVGPRSPEAAVPAQWGTGSSRSVPCQPPSPGLGLTLEKASICTFRHVSIVVIPTPRPPVCGSWTVLSGGHLCPQAASGSLCPGPAFSPQTALLLGLPGFLRRWMACWEFCFPDGHVH